MVELLTDTLASKLSEKPGRCPAFFVPSVSLMNCSARKLREWAVPASLGFKGGHLLPRYRNDADQLIELSRADQTFACFINVFTNAPCCGSFATV